MLRAERMYIFVEYSKTANTFYFSRSLERYSRYSYMVYIYVWLISIMNVIASNIFRVFHCAKQISRAVTAQPFCTSTGRYNSDSRDHSPATTIDELLERNKHAVAKIK